MIGQICYALGRRENMTLRDLLSENQPRVVPGPKCAIARIRQSLEPDDQAALDEAIAKIRQHRDMGFTQGQSGYNCSWLQSKLTEIGHQISVLVVQKHVRGGCACGN